MADANKQSACGTTGRKKLTILSLNIENLSKLIFEKKIINTGSISNTNRQFPIRGNAYSYMKTA
jgi:hypothetical protein